NIRIIHKMDIFRAWRCQYMLRRSRAICGEANAVYISVKPLPCAFNVDFKIYGDFAEVRCKFCTVVDEIDTVVGCWDALVNADAKGTNFRQYDMALRRYGVEECGRVGKRFVVFSV